MRIPAKKLCDLCAIELTGPYVGMAYPLDEADLKLLEAQCPVPTGGMFSLFPIPRPEHWSFEFCRGCAEGFMPMLADLKTAAIQRWLEERAKRANTPIGETDS